MDKNLKNTTDVWFIAFLMNKGHQITKYEVISRGKISCYFNINDNDWRDLKLEFNNSELIKFKALIQQIKDLGY